MKIKWSNCPNCNAKNTYGEGPNGNTYCFSCGYWQLGKKDKPA